jgi:hypothetical protein
MNYIIYTYCSNQLSTRTGISLNKVGPSTVARVQ